MAFIIWYQVIVEEEKPAGGLLASAASFLGLGLPLKVSNDVFSGSYILDADIKIEMSEGASADTFEATLIDLPGDLTKILQNKLDEGLKQEPLAPPKVKIHLGYFDEPSTKSQTVMEGALTDIKTSVGDEGKLVTVLSGQEVGGYRLRRRIPCEEQSEEGEINVEKFVRTLAQKAGVMVPPGSGLTLTLKDYTLVAQNGLSALQQIAKMSNSPLVIRDNHIFMGNLVGNEDAPDPFDPDTNLVKLVRVQESKDTRDSCPKQPNDKAGIKARLTYKATVLGNPKLRVGQNVQVKTEDILQSKLRISHLVHSFSSKNGYTCEVTLVDAKPGEPAESTAGAKGIINRIYDLREGTQNERPNIDMGQVTEYTPGSRQKHLASLNYRQSPPAGAVAPSVEVAIDKEVQLHNKPIASPFAWHKCGLVVPIYPGMRALLAHNRSLVNDALVTGFVWSENPRHEPPKNEPGDYWLCLPTEISNNQPTGKGVNDLTDKSGLRVIQAKGLHILVGENKLPPVGERPTPPAANTIVIEHQSGTKITIDSDGALKIETSKKDISLTNGSVSLNLSGSAVEVS